MGNVLLTAAEFAAHVGQEVRYCIWAASHGKVTAASQREDGQWVATRWAWYWWWDHYPTGCLSEKEFREACVEMDFGDSNLIVWDQGLLLEVAGSASGGGD